MAKDESGLNNFRMGLYEEMRFIRSFEENLLKLFDEGLLFGTTHTSIGQEALAVSLSRVTREEDIIFSNHRCHGHYLACRKNPKALLHEIMGRQGGVCEGYGGSQHIYDRNFYSNGIQGGYVPIVAGMALAEKVKRTQNIAVGLIGDGTLGEGLVYEGLNLMSILETPSLIIVENNQYAQSTPTKRTTGGQIIDRAKAFGISCFETDHHDVLAIHNHLEKAAIQVREEKRPFVFVHHTYRLGPHSKGDDDRPLDEIEKWKKVDPLKLLEESLRAEDVEQVKNRIATEIGKMTDEAKNAKLAELKNEFSKDTLWKEDTFKL